MTVRASMPRSTRRIVLVILALVLTAAMSAGLASTTAAADDANRPNIILITTDDQTVADLRFMPYTRRLLGGQGARFSDAVAPFPLCCPARATLMTGQLSHNNGVKSNGEPYGGYSALRPLNERTLPVWLQLAGYQTTFVGKYLNGYGQHDHAEVPAGWDSWNGAVEGLGTYNYYGVDLNQNGAVVSYDGQYQTDVYQDLLEDRVRAGAQSEKPFFIWQSNLAPHGACWPQAGGCDWGPPAAKSADLQKFDDLPLTSTKDPSFNERVVSDKPAHIRALRRWGDRRKHRVTVFNRARVASLQAVDRNVRDTVRLLAEVGELDNTLIMFASDNGYLLGQHRKNGKILPYEPSLAVPLLMRGPGIPAGVVRRPTTALVDIAPTIAEAAGATPLLEQDGRSLLGLARGTSTKGYGALSIEAGPKIGAATEEWLYQGVRTKRYTYVEYRQTGERELYDRNRDPYQLDNVAYRPTHSEVVAAMRAKLSRLRNCVGQECLSVGGAAPRPQSSPAPVHPDELGSIGDAKQVVTITPTALDARRGKAFAWQQSGRTWRIVRGPFTVKLGENGLVARKNRRHGTSKTPAGTFRPTRALGFAADPGTALHYRRLDRNDYWPFDPVSPYTSNVVQPYRRSTATWLESRAERFMQHRLRFPHALVTDYNLARDVSKYGSEFRASDPANPRRGALVLHVGNRLRNYGWASMEKRDLRWLLQWLRPWTQNPKIVVGAPRYPRNKL